MVAGDECYSRTRRVHYVYMFAILKRYYISFSLVDICTS